MPKVRCSKCGAEDGNHTASCPNNPANWPDPPTWPEPEPK